MRKSFRGAVTLALCLVANHATVLAQYPIVQPGLPYSPPQYVQPFVQPQVVQQQQQQPIQQPQSIAQPAPAPAPAQPKQPAPQPPTAKPVDEKAIEKAWLDRVITERLEAAVAKQAEKVKAEQVKAEQAAKVDPPKPPQPTGHAMPVGVFLDADRTSFESSTEEQARDYQTNGIDLAKIPTTVRITHGGEDLTVQQFGDELKARYGDKLFATDREKYWVGVFGGREFEDKVKHLLATDPQWKVIADRCIIDFKSAAGNEKLAWRWKSIDCDRPQGILVCAHGYDRASPDDACVAVHAQEDLVAFTNVIESPVNVQADTTTTAGSYEGSKRRNKDEPLPFSRVPNRRTIKGWFDQLSALQWLMGFGLPGFLIAGLIFRRQVGMSLKGVAWVVKLVWYGWGFWNKDKAADEPSPSLVVSPPVPQPLAPPPVTTPVVDQQPILCPCPTPTTDEMDQVDRSQDARLNRLEELVHNVLDRIPMQPVVAESARPVKRATTRTRKPAKR